MRVFISDLDEIIKKIPLKLYESKLSDSDLSRYNSITNTNRKKQFLIGRMLVYSNLNTQFSVTTQGQIIHENGYISLAHSKKYVVLIISDKPVGIDIEYLNTKRNYKEISKFLGFERVHSLLDFYKKFTAYEADFKSKIIAPYHRFIKYNDYLICLSTPNKINKPVLEKVIPFDKQ